MPIRACAECHSDRLQFPHADEPFRCHDCGWSGKPLEYASYAQWKAERIRTPMLA